MADMMNVAVSGLRAFQRALETTSHNIANAATEGYSRQRVELLTREPQIYGTNSLGRGVIVGSISRYGDDVLAELMQNASSTYSRLDTYATKAGVINNLFADGSTGLAASLQRFSNALQEVASTPNATSARQVLLSEAQNLAQRLQTYDQRLDNLETEVNQQLVGEASTINSIAANLAKLNQEIANAQAHTGQASADLLDARDKQLAELSKHVDTNIVRMADGSASVFVGNGLALVLGGTSANVVAKQDPYLPTRVTLAFQTPGITTPVDGSLSGGSVGGLLDFRRELLDPARNQIGQMAVGLAEVVNTQHREGIDLNGNSGTDLFAVGAVEVRPAAANSGSAGVAVTRTGAGALTTQDYILSYDGSAWTMKNARSGAAVTLTGTGTALNPLVGDGLSVVLSGTAATGDRFLVRPTATAVKGMEVLITDPAKVAAGAPIRSSAALANAGSATITAGEVLDATNAQLRSTVSLQFIDATHYSINGVGSNNYVAGSDIDINGWRVQISGTPAAGDTFTVSDNTGGTGDNRNALEMSKAMTRGILSGGADSLDFTVARFISSVGVTTNQANISLDAQKIVYDESVSSLDSVAGVNLDEEAASLLRYQQAYQAAAQMIRTTQTIFDSLLDATRR